ncbi:Scramblase-domain-containing protein [Flammula alnicola]|nr:Scramblase-domain-containing protein [Flammula alnicola]
MLATSGRQRLAQMLITNRLNSVKLLGLRTYAISRFPKRATGVGRKRPQLPSQDFIGNDNEPRPRRILAPDHDGLSRLLLHKNTLIIERQLEMMNVFIGFEQSNKYAINDVDGEPLGYIAEEPRGFLGTLSRQAFATHRPFKAVIMDKEGLPVLWVRRPFAWINSRMFVQRLKDRSHSPPDPEPVLETFGEVQQIWHPWRRRYDLFLRENIPTGLTDNFDQANQSNESVYYQIGKVDSGFLAWNFRVSDQHGNEIASVDRAFRGIGREVFTDTGKYSIHFTASGVQSSIPNNPEDVIKDLRRSTSKELNIDARASTLTLITSLVIHIQEVAVYFICQVGTKLQRRTSAVHKLDHRNQFTLQQFLLLVKLLNEDGIFLQQLCTRIPHGFELPPWYFSMIRGWA